MAVRRWLAPVALLLATWAVLEGVFFAFNPNPVVPIALSDAALQATSRDNEFAVAVDPYLGYTRNPRYNDIMARDEALIRTPESRQGFIGEGLPPLPTPSDLCVIGIFGGSVAEHYGRMRMRFSTPQVMPFDLPPIRARGKTCQRYQPVFFAGPGFKEPQPTFAFIQYAEYFDIIVNIGGWNEIAEFIGNAKWGLRPDFPFYSAWIPAQQALVTDTKALKIVGEIRFLEDLRRQADPSSWSNIYNAFVGAAANYLGRRANRLRGELSEHLKANRGILETHRVEAYPRASRLRNDDDLVREAVDVWIRNWTFTHTIAKQLGIVDVFIFQPSLDYRGAKKTLTDRERQFAASAQAAQVQALAPSALIDRAYGLAREIIASRRAGGYPFLDFTMMFADDERDIFMDSVHLLRDGYFTLHDRVKQAIVDRAIAAQHAAR